MTDLLFALLGAALASNLVLGLPLGADALRQPRSRALALAGGVLLAAAAPLAWLFDQFFLAPLNLGPLRLFLFLPLLAALAWLVTRLLARWRPALAVDSFLLLGNGAALGAMLLAPAGSLLQALGLGLGGGFGFWLALRLFDDLLTQVEQADVPAPFRGTPMLLICAGLMGLAFLGFNGFGTP
ncbi:Rnf-Nqr domain containing protein [Pseudomonas sp. Q1-7]|uniref:Rnf-Nqr domain containing protein n=1 Tax=Pseudomonas sp. Q1-7 TaxID=3020843 RepID=UPI0022FFDDFA|nr:Rnf-Nqr domain containing protein [Pseudomonas sp. Q1-7]